VGCGHKRFYRETHNLLKRRIVIAQDIFACYVKDLEGFMSAVLLGLMAAFSWSIHDLMVRKFAPSLGAFRLAFTIMLMGAALLVGIVLWRGQIWAGGTQGITYALLLGVAYACAVGGLYKGFSLAPVSIVGPLTAGYPALVVLWGMMFGLEPTAAQWIAIGIILAGTVVVGRFGTAEPGDNAIAPGNFPWVIGYCVLASFGFAASVVLGQNASIGLGEFESAFLSRFTAAAALLPFMILEKSTTKMSFKLWPTLMVIGFFDVAGVVAVNASGAFPDREFAAMGISAYGAISVILAMIFLKEKVTPLQWVGIAMIIGSVIFLAWP
jgi:drug/metabolite transporter (DMT)-like permease